MPGQETDLNKEIEDATNRIREKVLLCASEDEVRRAIKTNVATIPDKIIDKIIIDIKNA